MHHIHIDLETYSDVDIVKGGLYKYAQSPAFEILLLGYAIDDSETRVVDLTQSPMPDDFRAALTDPAYIKHAYNAAFEWYCLSRALGAELPINQWRDVMLHVLYCGYPASLDAAGRAIGLPADKRKLAAGKALIRTFCVPQKSGARSRVYPADEPEKWALFLEYNRQDVETERTIDRMLAPWPVPDDVQRQWETDLRINARGVGIDPVLVDGALRCGASSAADSLAEAQRITGLQNPNSVAQLKAWLQEQTGEETADLRKDTVAQLLASGDLTAAAQRALRLRQELGKTSTKKYAAMAAAECADQRVRGTLQFYGAPRTGRWGGRLVQPQNLPRTHLPMPDFGRALVKTGDAELVRLAYGNVPDTLSQLIRTALVPAPGCYFVDADFSAIEARVIAWLSGEDWVLDVFRTTGKIYEATAAQMFGVPVERIKKGNPEYELRQKGKVATLALGYQGGAPALIAMGALRMGIPENELPSIVQKWRKANPRIVSFWYDCENAAIECIQSGRPQQVNDKIAYALSGDGSRTFLQAILPSGRRLFYAEPKIAENRFGRPSICHMGQGKDTKKWGACETYGGKLVENITQAVARDCLAQAIGRLEAQGWHVVFHVHDEVIVEVPEASHPNREAALTAVSDIMRAPIDWAPGLPLDADGWTGAYYTKE